MREPDKQTKPDVPTDRAKADDKSGNSLDERSTLFNNPSVRKEFAHENISMSPDFLPIKRIGYLGGKREHFVQRMDKLYGEGNWTLGYIADGKTLTRDMALELYQKSYEAFFRVNPDFTQKLLREARDVYDTNISNVASGLDWHAQEDSRSHLQDIAVRRAVKELGFTFQGDKLLQIRGLDSDLPELNPGQVPFISPDLIISPSEFAADWVKKGSIEDFWQNNKFLFVRGTKAVIQSLQQDVMTISTNTKRQDWKIAGEKLATLIVSGAGSRDLVETFTSYVERLQSGDLKRTGVPDDYPTDMVLNVIINLPLISQAEPLSDEAILKICDALTPAVRASHPAVVSMSLSNVDDVRIAAASLCTIATQISSPSFADGEVLHALLTNAAAMNLIESSSALQSYLRNSKLGAVDSSEILNNTLSTCPSTPEDKERFIKAIAKARQS